MFVLTKKLTKKNLATMILAAGALLGIVILLVSGRGPAAEEAEVSTDRGRMKFIESYGWKVDPDEEETEEVTIPREFDEVYLKYNLLQKAQGMDLADYAGCTVERYTYPVLNYPTGENGVLINLLIYQGKVIGGDVMSPRLDGFMHGFEYFGRKAQ